MAIGFAALLAAAGVYLPSAAPGGSRGRRRVLFAVRRRRRLVRVVVHPQPARVRLVHRHQLHHPDAGPRPARRLPRALQTPWFWRKMHSDIWGAFARSGSLAGCRADPGDRVADRRRLPADRAAPLVAVGPSGARPARRDRLDAARRLRRPQRLADREVLHHGRRRPRAPPVRRVTGGGHARTIAFRVFPFNRRNTVAIIVIGGAMVLDFYLLRRFCNEFNPGGDTGRWASSGRCC